MRDSLKRLKPDRFEDIIAMVALYRPGPMDNIPTYINRKHGEEPVDCLHPMLEPILKETYGVIIYQEQVMQIAQVMAGYSLGEADLLRRAMGKKDKSDMAQAAGRVRGQGAVKNGRQQARRPTTSSSWSTSSRATASTRAHAAAYALVAYHTAYLKANYREEFLAASMTLDAGNTDKLAMFTAEAKKSGIAILPPCVNASEVDFLAEAPSDGQQRGAIRYSLAALKNIGAQAVESLVAERTANGAFKDLSDFAGALNTKALNKRALETLAAAGAFDRLEAQPRAGARQRRADAGLRQPARRATRRRASSDLFGGGGGPGGGGRAQIDMRPVKAWPPMERLQYEFEAVGFFLSGHPLDAYASVLAKLGIQSYAELEARADRGAVAGRLAGIVVSARERRSQKGNKFAFAMFSEPTGQFEAVIFSETLAASRPPAGARHGRAAHGGRRARRRGPEAARAVHPVARRGRQRPAEGPQGRARRRGRCGHGGGSTSSRRCSSPAARASFASAWRSPTAAARSRSPCPAASTSRPRRRARSPRCRACWRWWIFESGCGCLTLRVRHRSERVQTLQTQNQVLKMQG